MLRTVGLGILAVGAVLAILGAVLVIGILRIRYADENSVAVADPAPMTQPAATTQPGADAASGDEHPADALPVLDIQSVELSAQSARLIGGLSLEAEKVQSQKTTKGHGRRSVGPPDAPPTPIKSIIGWRSSQDLAEWSVSVPKAGVYEADVVYSSMPIYKLGFSCLLSVGNQELKFDVPEGKRHSSFKVVTFGNILLPAGPITVRFRISNTVHSTMLKVQSVRLIPAS